MNQLALLRYLRLSFRGFLFGADNGIMWRHVRVLEADLISSVQSQDGQFSDNSSS